MEVEHGTPEWVGNGYRFRVFPRSAPGTDYNFGSLDPDFDSVDEIRETRSARIRGSRESLNEFDLSRAGGRMSTDFRAALSHIHEAEERLGRARAKIEFEETGIRPPKGNIISQASFTASRARQGVHRSRHLRHSLDAAGCRNPLLPDQFAPG